MPRPPEESVEAPLPGILALAAALAVHLGLLSYFVPRSLFGSGLPVLTEAFGVEAYRVARAEVGRELFAEPRLYDPLVLGGQMAGFVEGLGTRAFPFLVPLVERLGVPPARAFTIIVLAHHAIVPLVGFAAARAFSLGRYASALTVALWSALWFFDSLVHPAWFTGRISFCLASGVVVLALGLARRALRAKTSRASVPASLGVAAAVGVALALHPVVGLFGAAAGVVHVMGDRNVFSSRRAAALLAHFAPLAVLAFPRGAQALRTSEPLSRVFHAAPTQMLWDLLEIPAAGYGAPFVCRTLFRTLALACGAVTLLRWIVRESRRARLLGGFTLACVVAGYFGALFPVSSPIEPYLFLVPGALAASIPAAEYLSFVRPRRAWAASSPRLRVVLTAAAVVIVPRLYRTVASYVPELLPTRVLRSDVDRRVSALVGLNEPLPVPLRHEAPPPGFRDIAAQVSTEIGTRGRIVVDDAALAAFLALTTELHVLGPLAERGASSTDADPTALLSAPPDHAALSRYLERFAVAEVVLCGAPGVLDRGDPLLDVPELVGGCRVRRVLREPSFFEAGRGRVDAHLGFIGVSGAVGERVTLRFHYDPRLVCRPGCAVEPAAFPSDGSAPFVTVARPPPSFELYAP